MRLNRWFPVLEVCRAGSHHVVLAGDTRGHKAKGEKPDRGLQR